MLEEQTIVIFSLKKKVTHDWIPENIELAVL